eukprot:355818-Chlamydomonas_euryale.AAC.2
MPRHDLDLKGMHALLRTHTWLQVKQPVDKENTTPSTGDTSGDGMRIDQTAKVASAAAAAAAKAGKGSKLRLLAARGALQLPLWRPSCVAALKCCAAARHETRPASTGREWHGRVHEVENMAVSTGGGCMSSRSSSLQDATRLQPSMREWRLKPS